MHKLLTLLICWLIAITEEKVPKSYVLDCTYKGSTIQLTVKFTNKLERHCFCLPVKTDDNDDLTISKDRYCTFKECDEECREVDFQFICKDPLCFCYDVKNPDQSEAYFKYAKIKHLANACPTLMDDCESQNSCVSDDNQQCDLADQKCVCKSGYRNIYGECTDYSCYSNYDQDQCKYPDNCRGPIKCETNKLHVKIELLLDGNKYTIAPTTSTVHANVTSSSNEEPSKSQWWVYLLIVLAVLFVLALIGYLIYKFNLVNLLRNKNETTYLGSDSSHDTEIDMSMKKSEQHGVHDQPKNALRYTQDPLKIIDNDKVKMKNKSDKHPDIHNSKYPDYSQNNIDEIIEDDQDNISQYEQIEKIDFFADIPKNVIKMNMIEKINLDVDDHNNRIINKYFKSSLSNQNNSFVIIQCAKITKKEDEEAYIQNRFFDDQNSFMLWQMVNLADMKKIIEYGLKDPIYQNGMDKSNKTIFYDSLINLDNYIDDDGYALLLLCRLSMGKMFETIDTIDYDRPVENYDSIKRGELGYHDYDNGDRLFGAIVLNRETDIKRARDRQQLMNEYIVFDPNRYLIKFLLVVKRFV